MKLSISNIAWEEKDNQIVYELMKSNGFAGVEIAPTRVIPELPYSHIDEAVKWYRKIQNEYGFVVPSMQSIWYGRQEKLFGTDEEREKLLNYTKSAIDFASSIGCNNLVFGCPRNRNMPEGADESLAVEFFKSIGDYAYRQGTIIGMEANPPIYNTNFINGTKSAVELIEKVDSEGFKLNLDVGTMIENGEDVSELIRKEHLINHVHVSEPGLKPIQKRELHNELADVLRSANYSNFVSIEVGKQDSVEALGEMMNYIKCVFE